MIYNITKGICSQITDPELLKNEKGEPLADGYYYMADKEDMDADDHFNDEPLVILVGPFISYASAELAESGIRCNEGDLDLVLKMREVAAECEGRVRDYSGRGMYGRYCIGIAFGSVSDAAVFCYWLGKELGQDDELGRDMPQPSFDNLGTGTIMYFPALRLKE